jgi:hypothetical protein
VRLAEDVEIWICSLAGLALMKLIAWNDRRDRYRKDAEDLGFIMSNCLMWGMLIGFSEERRRKVICLPRVRPLRGKRRD